MQSQPHQEFLELCALSTTEELSTEERMGLLEHLSHCPVCWDAKQAYEGVVSTTIPALGANYVSATVDESVSGSWSVDRAEEILMASLRDEPSPASHLRLNKQPKFAIWQHSYRYAAAAVLLLVFAVAAYQVGVKNGRGLKSVVVPTSPNGRSVPLLDHPGAQAVQIPPKADLGESELVELRRQSRLELFQAEKLKETQSQLENDLAKRSADLDRSSQERAALEQQLALAQSNVQNLQEKLSIAENQSTANATQSTSLEARLEALSVALQSKDQEIAKEQELLQHDRDVRNLIGARDLYIAEIYDVAKTGKTQKPFGRVFYTKDRSLIFYGYDLDRQQGIKDASTYQAWGRTGSGQARDVSLGLLYLDDATKKRWMLKVNDATTLAQLDAIFVTVEPKGGSVKPSGKPLLFTYLRLNPNHP